MSGLRGLRAWLLGLLIWQTAWVSMSSHATEVSLVFAGDTVLNDDAGDMIARGQDPFAPFASYLAQADFRMANLECVVSTLGEAVDKVYTFQAHPRVLPVIKQHFHAVALANNHSGDAGPVAFADMLQALTREGIGFVGGGMNLKEAHQPLLVNIRGVRIALLSYNEFHPRSFEAGVNLPGVAWSEDTQVVADIRAAKQLHRADVVIPIMHWGWENERQANARQRQLARTMVLAGADAVIGGHPHVTQEVTLVHGKPVIFSVGNFVMKETDNEHQRRGWLLKLFLDKKGVTRFETLPVRLDLQGLPSLDSDSSSPCWERHQSQMQTCPPRP